LTRSAGFPAEGLLLLTIILFYSYRPSYLTFQMNLDRNNQKTQRLPRRLTNEVFSLLLIHPL
jgi:hypothetical protein